MKVVETFETNGYFGHYIITIAKCGERSFRVGFKPDTRPIMWVEGIFNSHAEAKAYGEAIK